MSGRCRRGTLAIALVLTVALTAGQVRPASAAPQWVDDLNAKAAAYQERMLAAVTRLELAMAEAAGKLTANAIKRLAELMAILADTAKAATEVMAENAEEYAAIVHARMQQATAVADELERQVREIIAGTRADIAIEQRRLVTGTRTIVTQSLRDAGIILANARVVDDKVVARARSQVEAEAKRWLWLLLSAGGVIGAAVGIGLLWPRKRKGDSVARRPIVTGIGVIVIAGGLAGAVYGVVQWRAEPPGADVSLGEQRCDALADAERLILARRATAPERDLQIGRLARCSLLAASDASSELIADRLHKLHVLPVN